MLKKLWYGILVMFLFAISIMIVMYFAPATWVLKFDKWYWYEGEEINLQIPDKSMYVAEIPNTYPADAEYELIGSVLENADTLEKLDKQMVIILNKEHSCNTPYLIPKVASKTASKEEKKASNEEYDNFYNEKITIGGIEEKKWRLLQQDNILGDTADGEAFDTCEKALSTSIDALEIQKLIEKILSKTDSERRMTLGKDFILSAEKPEWNSSGIAIIQFSRLASFFFRFRNDSVKWNTGEQASEVVFDIARTLFSQKSIIGKAIAMNIASKNIQKIHVLTLVNSQSKPVFSKLPIKLQNPIFTQDSIRKEIIDSIYENVALAQAAPWYLRWSLLIDPEIVETGMQIRASIALSQFAGWEKLIWINENSPEIYKTITQQFWLQRNMLGMELIPPYYSYFQKSYYLSFLEKNFLQSLKNIRKRDRQI